MLKAVLKSRSRRNHRGLSHSRNHLARRDVCHRRPGFEVLEKRHLLSIGTAPELPGLYLVDPNLDNLRGQVIYLDFDGEENVTYNGPVTVGPFDVPAFQAPGTLAGQEADIISDVTRRLNDQFAPVSVTFTLEQPDADQPYSTIYFGGTNAPFRDFGSFVGLAQQVDVGNANQSDNGLVFSNSVSAHGHSYAEFLVYLTAHEVGHLLGYEHANEESAYEVNPLASVAAQTQLVTNGSFSSGTSGWTLSGDFWAGTNLPNYRTSPGYAAGGVDSSGTHKNNASGSMYQQFTIPATATSTTVSYWYYITSNETAVNTQYDKMPVDLLNSSGQVLRNLANYSNLNKGSGYQQASFNIGSSYAGQSVRVRFMATSDSSNTTTFRIDDVSVIADVPTVDTTKPTVSAFNVTPLNGTTGQVFTAFYTVSDSGGSGLNRVELWRANDSGGSPVESSWTEVKRTSSVSGNGPLSGSLTDTPASATGNVITETEAGWQPIKVTVDQPTQITSVSYNPADPTTGTLNQAKTVTVSVGAQINQPGVLQVWMYDADFSTQDTKWVYISTTQSTVRTFDLSLTESAAGARDYSTYVQFRPNVTTGPLTTTGIYDTTWSGSGYTINWTGQPDLTKQTDNVSMTSAFPGDTINATVTVLNSGPGTANSGYVYYYWKKDSAVYDNAYKIDQDNYGSLAQNGTANESFSFTVPAGTTPGTYKLYYWIDATNTTANESNEDNNQWAWTITVNQPTQITSVSYNPADPTTGTVNQATTVTVSVGAQIRAIAR